MKLLNLRQLTLAVVLIAAARPSFGAFQIVLDPGHGGTDHGAVHSNIKEAELVLKVASKLKVLLEKNPDIQVLMTRVQDRNIGLPERVKFAESHKADLFVSIHANAASDERAKGVEFFFQNNLPPDEESLFLASQENQAVIGTNKEVHDDELSKKGDVAAIIEDLHRQNRMMSSLRLTQTLTHTWENDAQASQATIKQAPFYVISKTSMPAVLIEVGFLTNPREAKRLLSAEYQNDLAQKIYNALVSYKEKVDNSEAKTLN